MRDVRERRAEQSSCDDRHVFDCVNGTATCQPTREIAERFQDSAVGATKATALATPHLSANICGALTRHMLNAAAHNARSARIRAIGRADQWKGK